eukprot:3841709-Rhodomonas_salina.2
MCFSFQDGTPTRRSFQHLSSEIGAEEAEEIGVEHLLRDIKVGLRFELCAHAPAAPDMGCVLPGHDGEHAGRARAQRTSARLRRENGRDSVSGGGGGFEGAWAKEHGRAERGRGEEREQGQRCVWVGWMRADSLAGEEGKEEP